MSKLLVILSTFLAFLLIINCEIDKGKSIQRVSTITTQKDCSIYNKNTTSSSRGGVTTSISTSTITTNNKYRLPIEKLTAQDFDLLSNIRSYFDTGDTMRTDKFSLVVNNENLMEFLKVYKENKKHWKEYDETKGKGVANFFYAYSNGYESFINAKFKEYFQFGIITKENIDKRFKEFIEKIPKSRPEIKSRAVTIYGASY